MKRQFRGDTARARRRNTFLRLIFFSALFLVGMVFLFRERLFGPHSWDEERRYSFIVDTSTSLILFSLSPLDNTITIVTIGPDIYLEVPRGYGTYKASAVYRLGELGQQDNNNEIGGMLLSETIQEVFGVPTEAFIRYNQSSTKYTTSIRNFNEWKTFREERFGFFPMLSFIRDVMTKKSTQSTNLHPFEIFKLFGIIRELSSGEVQIYDLKTFQVAAPFMLPDKSKVERIDSDRLDKVLEGAFHEQRILRENVTVGVLNASRSSGVAKTAARIVSAMGARVVSVGNAQELVPEKCLIRGTKEHVNSYTAQRIGQTFDCLSFTLKNQDEVSGPFELEFLIGEEYSL